MSLNTNPLQMQKTKEANKVRSHNKSNVFDIGSRSLHSWTMGRMLRANPHKKLRQEFLNSPYLDQIKFGDLFADPFAMEDFLQNCRRLPHCGEISIRRIREVIKLAADGKFHLTQAVFKRD